MTIPVPHVLLADAAFPAQQHILKPFPMKDMIKDQRIYNYGRRVVENAFGILVDRFRLLLHPISLARDKVVLFTQVCVLHNYIKTESHGQIIKAEDSENIKNNNNTTLHNVTYTRGCPSNRYIVTREQFKEYFNNHGAVPWQDNKA
ncbi:hypothetical protein ILUMI_09900 [Ignelater luminosus]|uniref:DDE Tnp4 domain-containing protein n=1 Tax=Ignelater luminosus TaxID=2038154 RepID=A0A8K0D873_IGNLU|nr:hypothetical protein ILUMI_09900 [Ignelater luminosus]